MIEIIESSIRILYPESVNLTIFNSEDRENPDYCDLSLLSGKKSEIEFRYLNENSEILMTTKLKIPRGLNELAVKNYILVMLSQDAKIYTKVA